MKAYPPTYIIRHRKENLKKCTLTGLENREDFSFFSYPLNKPFDVKKLILLSFGGEPLSIKDADYPLVILDGTWNYAKKMEERIFAGPIYPIKRSLPKNIVTAYPRKQMDCSDPQRGLASIEAIFVAYLMLGRKVVGLLDKYYWKKEFLELNRAVLRNKAWLRK